MMTTEFSSNFIGAVSAPHFLDGPYDHRAHDLALLDLAVKNSLFHVDDDDVAYLRR